MTSRFVSFNRTNCFFWLQIGGYWIIRTDNTRDYRLRIIHPGGGVLRSMNLIDSTPTISFNKWHRNKAPLRGESCSLRAEKVAVRSGFIHSSWTCMGGKSTSCKDIRDTGTEPMRQNSRYSLCVQEDSLLKVSALLYGLFLPLRRLSQVSRCLRLCRRGEAVGPIWAGIC